jgi:type II secretory pathway pseudopilin PulG
MTNRKAFTLVEIVTVVMIIALMMGLLTTSVVSVRARARDAAQRAQFHVIEMGIEAFKQMYGDYPPSSWTWDPALNYNPADSYCGAQKLAEALLGWDLMGFHPKTAWRADGYSGAGIAPGNSTEFSYDPGRVRSIATLSERKGPFLDVSRANAFRMSELYPAIPNKPYLLCDVYRVRKLTDKTTGKTVFAGSPILYYKANTANKTIDGNNIYAPPPTPPQIRLTNRIYDATDNQLITQLLKLNAYGPTGMRHPLGYSVGTDYPVFYDYVHPYPTLGPPPVFGGNGRGYGIRDSKFTNPDRPYNPDSYILISAGPDGYYGTEDDIHNY